MATVAVLVPGAAGCAASPGASATADELRAALAPCDIAVEQSQEARSFLVDEVQTWYPVSSVLEAHREPQGELHHLPARLATTEGDEIDLEVHSTSWPGIDWALAHDAPVWVGVTDPTQWGGRTIAAAIMIQAPDGGIVFPGQCSGVVLDDPLHEQLGADADEILARIPTVDDATARRLLGLDQERRAAAPSIPEDTPAAVLDRLSRVRLDIRLTEALGTGEDVPSVCLHITEGWSDCLPGDATAVAGSDLLAYVGADRRVELWFVRDGDVTNPIGMLGAVDVPAGTDRLDLVVDTTDLDLTGLVDSAPGDAGLVDVVGQPAPSPRESRPGG